LIYALLLVVGLAAVLVYVLVIFREVPGAVSERWGELEGLPEDLGQWKPEATSPQARLARERGLSREVRTFLELGAGRFGGDRLVLQARYRSLESGRIERSDPDVALRRRRRKG
jgi:hypothetical protein